MSFLNVYARMCKKNRLFGKLLLCISCHRGLSNIHVFYITHRSPKSTIFLHLICFYVDFYYLYTIRRRTRSILIRVFSPHLLDKITLVYTRRYCTILLGPYSIWFISNIDHLCDFITEPDKCDKLICHL